MDTTPNLLSQVSVVVLGATDLARSVAFYRDTLGLELSGEAGELAFFPVSGLTLMLSSALARHGGPVAGATEVVFGVESVTAGHAVLTERGCTFLQEPREVTPGTWAATLTDPDGHKLTLLGPR